MTDNSNRTDLFSPVTMGKLQLANRIVMAPVTRSRYGEDGVPNELHATYYAQRASAGLIISEATNISAQGRGYAATPGIWSDEQVAGWKKVTDAVHAEGGKIVCQLWHVGRFSSVELQPNGERPVAPPLSRPKARLIPSMASYRYRRRARSKPTKSRALLSSINVLLKMPCAQVLTAWKCTLQTAICSISSCATQSISGPTPTADLLKTARA